MNTFKCISKKSKIILIFSLAMVFILILAVGTYISIVSRILEREYEPDLIISSPDSQHELVVREYSCLGGAGAEIYIRKPGQDKWYNSWLEKKIGNAGTDDYYRTFSNGTYHVEWESDKVTIHYYKGVPIENRADRSTWCGVVTYDLD